MTEKLNGTIVTLLCLVFEACKDGTVLLLRSSLDPALQ